MKEPDRVQEALPIFHLTIPDKDTLCLLYMPFVKNGGFFIPARGEFSLGERVFFLLRLPGLDKKHAALGQIFWISNTKEGRGEGIGIRFSHQEKPLGNKIKTLLRDTRSPGVPTCVNSPWKEN